MGKGNYQPNSNANKKSEKTNDKQISEAHIGFTDFFFGILTTVFLGLAGILGTDAQFRLPGIFFFMGGILSGVCGIFIHLRHPLLNNKRGIPLKSSLAFCAGIVCLATLGASQWWFVGTKDNDVFNVLVNPKFFTPPGPGMTPYNAAPFLPKETVLHPINQLLYVHITNRTALPRRLAGVSIETAEKRWWWPKWAWDWPAWVKLCPVELLTTHLIFSGALPESVEIGDEFNFEKTLADRPLPPYETISGWLAWECPKGNACDIGRLRVGVADASGIAIWQTIEESSVPSTLQSASMRPVRHFSLLDQPFRKQSSCR